MYEQIRNISKEMENPKRNQREILVLKSIIITEIINPLGKFKGRFEQAEKGVNKQEDKEIEIMESKEKKDIRLEKSKHSLREMWDTTKWTNI